MFVIRQATSDDHAALLKLARTVSVSSPLATPDEMIRLIGTSRDSFAGRVGDHRKRRLLFVLEDTETGGVAGSSGLRACVSGADDGLAYLHLEKRQHYSDDLQTGLVHTTLELRSDERPTSQLHDLVVSPPYRGHREHLGTLLSLVRLHFIGTCRTWFADRILAEILPPPMADRRDSLWEHLGRRFVNLPRVEAERLREHSREFITALFPTTPIYVSLLAPQARTLIGKVDREAAFARSLLERHGFTYEGRIEPFGGGPVLEAAIDDVAVVGRTRTATLGDPAREYPQFGIVSRCGGGTFRAVRCHFADAGDRVSITGDAAGLLGVQVGDTVGVTGL